MILADNPPILLAMRGIRPNYIPIWFMRQAGRSLPEYHEVRSGKTMLEACLIPEVAAEITLQPVRRHKVDAAVFFSDIMVPLKLAGVDVNIEPGIGPVVTQPVRTAKDVESIVNKKIDDFSLICDAVKLACAELKRTPSGPASWTPLIGFAGAPFTIAAYLVEGKPSRDHLAARAMMYADPISWQKLMSWVADLSGQFMRVQVESGASAVQLFDSWAGSLSANNYSRFVAPYSAQAFSYVSDTGVPGVHFGVRSAELLNLMANVVADQIEYPVQGVDERLDLAIAIERINRNRNKPMPVQGNLDPAMLNVPWPILREHINQVLNAGRQAPAHIVNLGHGVPPNVDPKVLTEIVSYVHKQESLK